MILPLHIRCPSAREALYRHYQSLNFCADEGRKEVVVVVVVVVVFSESNLYLPSERGVVS